MEKAQDRPTAIVPMPVKDTTQSTTTGIPPNGLVYPAMWPYCYTDPASAVWSHEGIGLLCAQRRKLIPKDSTGALKLWLGQHKRNPYPTKAEKIMLAILSKMTLTQVSTWFANARRRLKKEFPVDYVMDASDVSSARMDFDRSETSTGVEFDD